MITYSRVVKIEPKTRISSARMVGGQPTSETEDLGYYMLLEGSHEMLFCGRDRPTEFAVGDRVAITIRKVP